MRIKTLIAGVALAVAATGALLAALAMPAAAEPITIPAMTSTDLKLFCQKNNGTYRGIDQTGWYTCSLPNGRLIACKGSICQISLEPAPTTPPRTIVDPTATATTIR